MAFEAVSLCLLLTGSAGIGITALGACGHVIRTINPALISRKTIHNAYGNGIALAGGSGVAFLGVVGTGLIAVTLVQTPQMIRDKFYPKKNTNTTDQIDTGMYGHKYINEKNIAELKTFTLK